MRDFDAELPSEDDRTFKLSGETFVLQMVSGEALSEYEDADLPSTGLEATQRLYRRLEKMLTPDDQARLAKLQEDGKVPYLALAEINRWASGIQSGRPTEAASSSQPGRGGTSRTSGRRSSGQADDSET